MEKDMDEKENTSEEIKINWFDKLLLKFWPKLMMRKFAKKMGIKEILFDAAHEVFHKVERIDFFPLFSQQARGFLLVLDGKTALYFYQDGDHFIYDGYEMGEYGKGDVTLFDDIKNRPDPFT